jgi:MATE family multidrug resistance protein
MPSAAEAQLLAPLWAQPLRPNRNDCDSEHRYQTEPKDQLEHDYDISSLAFGFVPFPFTSGGATYTYTMDAPEARRFSTSTAERVGLLKHHDNASKQHQYGTLPDPAEIESLLGDGAGEELAVGTTTAGQEAKLLFKYSLPLMGTYLLQYSFSLVTIFVVGHSE